MCGVCCAIVVSGIMVCASVITRQGRAGRKRTSGLRILFPCNLENILVCSLQNGWKLRNTQTLHAHYRSARRLCSARTQRKCAPRAPVRNTAPVHLYTKTPTHTHTQHCRTPFAKKHAPIHTHICIHTSMHTYTHI